MKITRRKALKLGLMGTGTLLSPFGVSGAAQADETPPCLKAELPFTTKPSPFSPLIDRFKAPLYIPKPLEPKLRQEAKGDQPAIDYYEITMQKQPLGVVFDEKETPLKFAEFWTYNGTAPGSLIRQKKGRQSCVRFINLLDKDDNNQDICTSVHLHGMASLPQYDGYAEDLIPHNHYKDYYYPNSRASILWYHDHAVHKTSRNVYMGLAGMYIVEYSPEDFCKPEYADLLPKGEFEVPLVIQDKTFEIPNQTQSNQWKLVFNDRQRQGVYADLILVNGRAYPSLKVKRQKYYFRLLNGSASRTYQLTLSRSANQLTVENDPLTVVGSDAGLLSRPEPLVAPGQSLRMGVAERYGVVVDFAKFPPGVKTVYLWDMGFPSNIAVPSQALMQFELEGEPIPTPELPAQLGKVTLPEELLRIRNDRLKAENRPITLSDRTFRFVRGRDWAINGRVWDANHIEGKPGLWDVEIWELVNGGGWVHPVHIHLIDFQILERNGRPPLRYEQGWKDVVLLHEFETVRVIASFNPQPGKYMMHCHNIVHEDHDMMTQFEVIRRRPEDPLPQDPLSAPAQPLPAKTLGSNTPPLYRINPPTYGVLKHSCSDLDQAELDKSS
jgi:spore coat protein A, manganese oxidase